MSESMHRCHSSLRAVPLAETRRRAETLAPSLGITRVTDTTRLDRMGIPVYASIRPGAAHGSLCVNAGKGVLPEEAHVGALMEAIEYALAEPDSPFAPPVIQATVRDVLDGRSRPDAILDLAPLFGAAIPPDAPLECVEAGELLTGGRVLVPACLVFVPYDSASPVRKWFSGSTNGLASGNTLLEATVHGLAETLEHDISSFFALQPGLSVRLDTLPPAARALIGRMEAAGCRVWVRTAENDFRMPFFCAEVTDPSVPSPRFLSAATVATRTAASQSSGRCARPRRPAWALFMGVVTIWRS